MVESFHEYVEPKGVQEARLEQMVIVMEHIDGLAQNCSNSIANELELLEYCTKPSIYILLLTNTFL